ncbi:hypothetical protein ACFQLX_02260 [Streptomyces polyrhachis]|uniref:Uncharacterized protein n=1 Tax=Streptomyces polyrhachis TaxID=1282885 RepID=A0ABW2G8D2_9ACTN
MEPLPYVDDQDRVIHAPPEQVWPALLATVRPNGTSPPGPIARVMRPFPAAYGGGWSLPEAGDSVPGFQVTAVEPLRRVELRGGHWVIVGRMLRDVERRVAA